MVIVRNISSIVCKEFSRYLAPHKPLVVFLSSGSNQKNRKHLKELKKCVWGGGLAIVLLILSQTLQRGKC